MAQRYEEDQTAQGRVRAEDLRGPPAHHLRGRTRLALPTDDSAVHEIEAPQVEFDLPSDPDLVYRLWDAFQVVGLDGPGVMERVRDMLACIRPEHSWFEVSMDSLEALGFAVQQMFPSAQPMH